MNGQRCDCCQYWRFDDDTDSTNHPLERDWFVGECKRFPPTRRPDAADELIQASDAFESPITTASNWCGEFKIRVVLR